jgi:uncharacterized protein involved in type VI secretion and phage assembly
MLSDTRSEREVFEIPTPGRFNNVYLAEVESAVDRDKNLGRVKLRLLNADDVGDQDGPIWAMVAVPFAGSGMGAFMIPKRGDQVLVTFIQGDPRCPVVIGGVWSGSAKPPEKVSDEDVKVWSLTSERKSRIALDERAVPTIKLNTPNQNEVSILLSDEGGGKVVIKAKDATITLDSQGITLDSPLDVTIKAGAKMDLTAPSGLTITASQVTVNGATTITPSVTTPSISAATYSPGIGNIW